MTIGGTTLEDYYSGIVMGFGAAAQDAERSVDEYDEDASSRQEQ